MKIYLSLIIILFSFACTEFKKEQSGYIESKTETKNQDPLTKSMELGAGVYQNFCVQCHLTSGKGVPNNFPPLAGSNWLTEKRTESIYAVKFGQKGEIVVNGITYDGIMTPMGLSDEEVANVLNYVMNSWGNKQDKLVTKAEVTAVEK